MDIDLGNYTGPYWSDGKIQESVEFGESEAKNALDELSRLHDTAYAHYKDEKHRAAADEIYYEEAKKLTGKFPQLAAAFVKYGNYTMREASSLVSDVGKFSYLGPLGMLAGLIYHAGGNIVKSQEMIDGVYLKKEKQDVFNLYSTDPKRKSKFETPQLVVSNYNPIQPAICYGPDVNFEHPTEYHRDIPEYNAVLEDSVDMVYTGFVGKKHKRKRRHGRR